MATLDLQVTSGPDDATGTLSESQFSHVQGASRCDSSTSGDSARWLTGLRFVNVTIPAGATITAAYLTLVLSGTSDDANLDAYGEAADNAVSFATNGTIIGRSRTSASVTWVQANEPNPAMSPSLVTLIQEIVDRGGWASGNALSLILIGRGDFNGQFRFVAYDGTPAQAPTLHIEYTAGSSGIDGSLTATLDDATLTATGELPITGTTAVTLASAVLSAAGVLAIEGQATVTLAGATLAAEATLALTGQAAIVLDDVQLAAEGSLVVEGTLSSTLEPATLEAAGSLALTGALDVTLDDAQLAATGVLGEAVTGTLDVLLEDATLNAMGSLALSGSLSRTLDPATLNADGTLNLSGALSATLDPTILNADGTLNLAAALSATLDPATLDAAGRLAIVGQLAATLADATLVASGAGPVLVVVEGAIRSPGRAASIQSPPNASIIYSNEVGHV